MKQMLLCAAASLVSVLAASTANAQHVDESFAERARQFEPTLIAAETPESRRTVVREFLRLGYFTGMVGDGPDGAQAIYIFSRSSYAYQTMGEAAQIRVAPAVYIAVAARNRQRGIWVNPSQSSEFYLSPAQVIEALETNPDLVPPPPPPIVIR